MVNLNKAFEVDSLMIDEVVGILAGADDPSILGQIAPVGSLYLRTNGDVMKKSGVGNIDWSVLESTTLTQTSTNEYNGSISVNVNYSASDKVVIFVDSTANPITITLPDAALFLNRIFHVKWKAGSNQVSITAQTGQVIDVDQIHLMGCTLDSFELVSDGLNWYIV